MTKRERLLAIAVGSMFGVVGVLYLINSITGAFDDRSTQLLEQESTLAQQKRDIMFGKEAARKLAAIEEKSLPADVQVARTAYQGWLLRLADETVKLEQVQVTPQQSHPYPGLYSEHRFLVSAYGDMEQVVDFMVRFHQTDYMHRLGQVVLNPVKESNLIKITMRADCLSLESSTNASLPDRAAVDKLAREREEYVEMIAHRNPFAPANKAPQFAKLAVQKGNPNKPLVISPKATDENEGDEITYKIVGEKAEDAEIDPKTGRIELTPSKVGELEFLVSATDNGLPALSDELLVKVVIAEPTPEVKTAEAELDPATQAFVTGFTESGAARQVWVQVRTEGRQLRLSKGDRLAVGTVQGVIAAIRVAEADIRTDDGKVITVSLGKALVSS